MLNNKSVKMDLCLNYCLIVSLSGMILIVNLTQLFLGITISIESPYNHIENHSTNSLSCYLASAIYAFIAAALILYLYSKNRTPRRYQAAPYVRLENIHQEIQLHEFKTKQKNSRNQRYSIFNILSNFSLHCLCSQHLFFNK